MSDFELNEDINHNMDHETDELFHPESNHLYDAGNIHDHMVIDDVTYHQDHQHSVIHDDHELAEISTHLSDMSIDTHTAIGVSQLDLLGELLQGRQVYMYSESAEYSVHDPMLTYFNEQMDGKSIFVREIDSENPEDLKLIIADSNDPDGPACSVPIETFLHDNHDVNYSYVATNHPVEFVGSEAHDFDQNTGFITEAFDFIVSESPRLATGVCSFLLGHEVGELLDSDVATMLSHYATDRFLENFVAPHKDQQHPDDTEVTTPISTDEKIDLMRKI